jgi:hypothetical protein
MQTPSVADPGVEHLAPDSKTRCPAITRRYAPAHLGIGGTEQVLATFRGEMADRHLPSGPTTDEAGVDDPGKK